MEYINKVEIQGRVGNIRTNNVNGSAVANLTIATEHLYKNRDGVATSETTWHNVVAWSNSQMPDFQKISKGSALYISGRLRLNKYSNEDGVEKQFTEILAKEIKLVSENVE